MKKLSSILLTLLLTLVSIPAAAYDFEVDGIYYNITSSTDLTVEVTYKSISYNSYSGDITIPETVTNGSTTYTVTSIGNYSFYTNANLTNVTLSSSIKTIGVQAFYACTKLSSFTLPANLSSIGNNAFKGCSGLYFIYNFSTLNIKKGEDSNGCVGYYAYIIYNDCAIENGYVFAKSSTSTPELCDYRGSKTDLVFPDDYNGKAYIIAERAFEYNTSITSVDIPETVASAGIYAFYGCTNLKSVKLPNNWVSIPQQCFQNCTKLSSITLPESISSIGAYAFDGCTSLSDIDLPSGLTNLGVYSFRNCSKITHVEIPKGITSMGEFAFYGCTNLKSVTLPENLTSIETYAFGKCTALSSINFPSHLTYIGKNAFLNCAFTSIELPESLTSTDTGVFADCTALTSAKVPSNLTTLSAYFFQRCTSLTEVVLPENLDSINKCAFDGCTALAELELPSNLAFIGDYAFRNCYALHGITIPANVSSIGENAFSEVPLVYITRTEPALLTGVIASSPSIISVPADSYDTYVSADVWSEMADILFSDANSDWLTVHTTAKEATSDLLVQLGGEDAAPRVVRLKIVGSINSYDFIILRNKMVNLRELDLSEATIVANSYEHYTGYCSHDNEMGAYLFYQKPLTNIILPNSLTSIEQHCFDGSSLRCNLVIPESVTKIQNYAFNGCNTLLSLDIQGTPALGTYAFSGCTVLNEIDLHLKSMSDYAFSGCTQLKNATVQASGSIGSYCFNGCTSLKNADLNTTSNIGNYTFNGCTSLQSAKVQTTGSVGNYSFQNCSSLQDAELQVAKSIGTYSMVNCTSLKTLKIENATSIGKNTINNCTALKTIELLNVRTISSNAFEGYTSSSTLLNSSVQSVKIQGATTIGDNAFLRLKALTELELPEELTSLGSYAFSGCNKLSSVVLPPALKTIGTYAFENCSALTSLNIPPSVQTIGDYAFKGCPNLNDIYTYTAVPTSINQDTFSSYETGTIHVPTFSYWTYYFDTQWSQFLNIVPFDEPYTYFYADNDMVLDDEERIIEDTSEGSDGLEGDLYANGGFTIHGSHCQHMHHMHLHHNGTHGASVKGEGSGTDTNLHCDNVDINIKVGKGKWHFFCFPFDVDLNELEYGGKYVWRYYDAEERAQKGTGGWKNVTDGRLEAGRGYIFNGNAEGTLRLKFRDVHFDGDDRHTELDQHLATNAQDASWNFVGNPFTSYYDIVDLGFDAPITVWNGTVYEAKSLTDDDYQLHPYEAFFVQKPESHTHVGFDADHRYTKRQTEDPNYKASAQARRRARQGRLGTQRTLLNLTLTCDSLTDKTRIVLNETRSTAYELECDAAKFFTTGVPQLYTLDDAGAQYAINERPLADGIVRLAYSAATKGTHRIALGEVDPAWHVTLVDLLTNTSVELTDDDYEFTSEAGTFEGRFRLYIYNNGEATGITDAAASEGAAPKNVYDLQGRRLAEPAHGVNVVDGRKKIIF